MTIALVVHVAAGSHDGGGTATTAPVDTTGADLLVVEVASYNNVPPTIVTDSYLNVWFPLTSYGAPPSLSLNTLYYAKNPTVGPGHTFTSTSVGGTSYPALCVIAFGDADVVSPFDRESGGSGSFTVDTGSITPTTDDQVVVTGICFYPADVASITAGFTITDTLSYASGSYFGVGMAYLIQTVAAPVNAVWTMSGGDDCQASIASFKTPSSAPSNPAANVPHIISGRGAC